MLSQVARELAAYDPCAFVARDAVALPQGLRQPAVGIEASGDAIRRAEISPVPFVHHAFGSFLDHLGDGFTPERVLVAEAVNQQSLDEARIDLATGIRRLGRIKLFRRGLVQRLGFTEIGPGDAVPAVVVPGPTGDRLVIKSIRTDAFEEGFNDFSLDVQVQVAPRDDAVEHQRPKKLPLAPGAELVIHQRWVVKPVHHKIKLVIVVRITGAGHPIDAVSGHFRQVERIGSFVLVALALVRRKLKGRRHGTDKTLLRGGSFLRVDQLGLAQATSGNENRAMTRPHPGLPNGRQTCDGKFSVAYARYLHGFQPADNATIFF